MAGKDKLSVRDIATIGISVALLVVIGMVLVVGLTSLVALPSSMIIFATPLMTMIYTVACLKTRKIGTISLICLVFGILMVRITFIGVLAVALAALLCDIVTKLVFKNYDKNKNIVMSTPLMCTFGVWTAYLMLSLFTVESTIFNQAGISITIGITVFVYILGLIVAKLTEKIFSKRVSWAKDKE